MKEKSKVVKMRRVIEFFLMFLIVFVLMRLVYPNFVASTDNNLSMIISVVGILLVLTAIVFIVIEVRSNDVLIPERRFWNTNLNLQKK